MNPSRNPEQGEPDHDGDFSDMLSELRILIPGSQTLTAFLIILPFNNGFAQIRDEEKIVYVVTFLCAVASLICFTAPAAQHRLQRPLLNREHFKNLATRYIILGLMPLSVALVLATQLVLSQVIATIWFSWAMAGALACLIAAFWWLIPLSRRRRHETNDIS